MGMSNASRWSLNSDDSGKSDSGGASSFDEYVSEITRPGTVHRKGRFIYLNDTDRTEHVGRILKIVPGPTYVAVERAFRPVNFPSVGGPNPTGRLAYLYTDSKKAASKRQRTATSMSSEISRPNTRSNTSRLGSASLFNRMAQSGMTASNRDLLDTARESAKGQRNRTISIADSDCFSDRGSV